MTWKVPHLQIGVLDSANSQTINIRLTSVHREMGWRRPLAPGAGNRGEALRPEGKTGLGRGQLGPLEVPNGLSSPLERERMSEK